MGGTNSSIMDSSEYGENFVAQIACGICFNKYECAKFIPMSLKCGHTYCKLCIDKLISTNPECPVCRTAIPQNCPVKNYALLDLISWFENEESTSETFSTQLKELKEELTSEIDKLHKKSQILTKKLEKVSFLLEHPMDISIESINTTITKVNSTLNFFKQGSHIFPKIIASPLPDPLDYMLKIYRKVESGTKMMCVHQSRYNSGPTYGNISVWSNTLFFHSLTTLKSSNDCKEFLLFDDLKKVMSTMKIKTFLKIKTKTKANLIVFVKPLESPLVPQFIRLCTGETGSCYKGSNFEKGEDKDSYCKSVMKLVSYKTRSKNDRGNVDYAFETTEEVCFRDPETVVVGSLDGGFQIFYSDCKVYYKNVVGVIETPLNIKDLLSYDTYDNVKIIESGIAFQF